MIDEIYEVNQYLRGENIDKKNLHRICYLLAKYYKEQGLNHLKIRENIFDWAKSNGVFFTFGVNDVIYQVLGDNTKLRGDIPIYITQSDINEINSRFDKKPCKHLALAILSYAKATANRDGEVTISAISFAHWVGLQRQHISSRYIPELIDFDFMERISDEETYFMWDKNKPISKNRRYKLKVPITNESENALYKVNNNNIKEICNEVFK